MKPTDDVKMGKQRGSEDWAKLAVLDTIGALNLTPDE